jgi:hypothetical protein
LSAANACVRTVAGHEEKKKKKKKKRTPIIRKVRCLCNQLNFHVRRELLSKGAGTSLW